MTTLLLTRQSLWQMRAIGAWTCGLLLTVAGGTPPTLAVHGPEFTGDELQ